LDITEEQQKIMNLFLNDESVKLSTIEKEFSDLPKQKVRYFLDGLIHLEYLEYARFHNNQDINILITTNGRAFLF